MEKSFTFPSNKPVIAGRVSFPISFTEFMKTQPVGLESKGIDVKEKNQTFSETSFPWLRGHFPKGGVLKKVWSNSWLNHHLK